MAHGLSRTQAGIIDTTRAALTSGCDVLNCYLFGMSIINEDKFEFPEKGDSHVGGASPLFPGIQERG